VKPRPTSNALAASVFATFATFAAHADCPAWSVLSLSSWQQSNDIVVSVTELQQDGSSFTGRAKFLGPKPPEDRSIWCQIAFCGRDPQLYVPGELEGEVVGQQIRIKVFWSNNETGIYEGSISATGRADGMNYVQTRPETRVSWYTTAGALTCDSSERPDDVPPPNPAAARAIDTDGVADAVQPPPDSAAARAVDRGGVAGAVKSRPIRRDKAVATQP
jgi:hypothetical protein